MVDFPPPHPRVSHLAAELTPCVNDLIVQPQVRRFHIGRTSDLRRRARRSSCDGIVSLHGEDDHALIAGLEEALLTRFGDHPKRAAQTATGANQDTEVESRFVYLAVWYRRS
ncbi:MAG TPA: hypothetical protein VEL07_23555 [Planctomycetota bacterium]|nr:hypothetical protein [Planctomycetota bacterium]